MIKHEEIVNHFILWILTDIIQYIVQYFSATLLLSMATCQIKVVRLSVKNFTIMKMSLKKPIAFKYYKRVCKTLHYSHTENDSLMFISIIWHHIAAGFYILTDVIIMYFLVHYHFAQVWEQINKFQNCCHFNTHAYLLSSVSCYQFLYIHHHCWSLLFLQWTRGKNDISYFENHNFTREMVSP